MLARVLESHGLATTSISLVREHTEKLKPPRALFVPFPFGRALGRPNDAALQHRVLRAALDLLNEAGGPTLSDFPDDADMGDQPFAPLQASAIVAAPDIPGDPAQELSGVLGAYERWRTQNGGRTAFGLTGVPAAQFADVIRFLAAFAQGAEPVVLHQARDVPLPSFVRWCADDLKSLYYESYLAAKPSAGGEELARWFWSTTASAQLLRRVRDRLDASEDPRWKTAAFGVAR